jgi:hypothetical protein
MPASIFRSNSRLARNLGPVAVEFISFAAGSVQRILPHVQIDGWQETTYQNGGAFYTSPARDEIRCTITIGAANALSSRSLSTNVRRRQGSGVAKLTLDGREFDICRRIFERIDEIADDGRLLQTASIETIASLQTTFDETVVARHLGAHFGLKLSVGSIFNALHQLSQQTYENKALVFGCLLNGAKNGKGKSPYFPEPFLNSKKYKALSDGFRTAYEISSNGQILEFVELDELKSGNLTEKHYYPDWSASLARASLNGICAIALTRQGDILVFDRGTVRFTYRFGRWQYWNHKHVIGLLRDKAKAQHIPVTILGRVVGAIYRAALDVSFRRSGGLFVIIHAKKAVRKIVRHGDAVGDSERADVDAEFDAVVKRHKMQSLPRTIAAELAALDGAMVLANSGEILAYGAILQPEKKGRLKGTEGSRTKAAVGASNYGIAVKISSDGDISVYHQGSKFISV